VWHKACTLPFGGAERAVARAVAERAAPDREWSTGYGDASACLKLRIPLTRRGSAQGHIKSRACVETAKMAENDAAGPEPVLKRGRADDLS